MDAKADTENVEEVEWHGNIENPSVCGPSRTAGSDEEEDEGKDGTAASPRQGGMDCPMEISSSSDSPGGIFSEEDVITGSEGEDSGGDGESSSYNEDAKEGGPVPAGLGNTYGINMDGDNRIRQTMNDMVREASKGAGIHSIINTGYYSLQHEVLQGRDQPEIKTRLAKASKDVGFELTPFQTETIVHTVWRPRTTLKVDYTIPRDKHVSRRFSSPSSDIGSPVLVDLPPGTGKTIVCVLACFLVSLERGNEIPDQAATFSSNGFVEESVSERNPNGGRVSMIFVPKHVHHQWVAAASKAVDILLHMYPEKLLYLGQNQKASKVTKANLDAGVVICDSSGFGLGKALEPETTYGALCFDESTENCDAKNNAVYSQVPHDLSFGRVILISADFSKMADSNSKSSSRPGAMLRKIFGDASINHYRRAFRVYDSRGYSDFTKSDSDGGCRVVATLTMNAVFPASKRAEVVAACSNLLKDVSLYTFGIHYKKSVLERLGNAAADDLTSVDGNERFKDAVGVDISDCKSIAEIISKLSRILDESKQPRQKARPKVEFGLRVLEQVVGEPCPICLDPIPKGNARIMQPCFHVICEGCLLRLETETCPFCRKVIESTLSSSESAQAPTSVAAPVPDALSTSPTSLGEAFEQIIKQKIPKNDGSFTIHATMDAVLRSLREAHDRVGGGTFRLVVVCAQVDLNTTGFGSEGYEIIRYKTTGTTQAPVSRKKLVEQLEEFQNEDGKKKLMLVHDETSGSGSANGETGRRDDNITGMDFPKLEAVVSIGSENRSQRVGRLCRMSRIFMPEKKRDAVYVELSGL